MASWDGDCVHAALNIQDVNDEATIKPNWAKRCSNLIIHRLPDGIYIESCDSYRELKQILYSRWSGKVSGVELGFAEADDFETAAAYADANLEEDFSIGGASGNTNCTKFAMEFGMAIGYSRTHVNDAVMSLMAKIVPKRDQETLIDKLEQMSI
jgi:hypothetical protein